MKKIVWCLLALNLGTFAIGCGSGTTGAPPAKQAEEKTNMEDAMRKNQEAQMKKSGS